jgi:hypothetical protein
MRLAHIRFDRRPITFDGDAKGGPDQADEDQSPDNDDNCFHEPKFWHALTPGKAFFARLNSATPGPRASPALSPGGPGVAEPVPGRPWS